MTSRADSGTGTLRWAIQQANGGTPGDSALIKFTISGTITLASALPAISRTVTISGQTAPGYKSGGAPVVEVNFSGSAGLQFAPGSGGSQLLSLSLGGGLPLPNSGRPVVNTGRHNVIRGNRP